VASYWGEEKMVKFRFQDLKIWQLAIKIADELFDIADKKDFSNFLNIARRSTFDNANTVILLEMRRLISKDKLHKLLKDLDVLCRQITNFQKSLKKSYT
jgi:four helix bundle protein